jgi:hypothetical protein
MSLRIASPAFGEGGAIPAMFTCEGVDRSPALSISGAPPGTKSFALIVDDPDAPDPEAPRKTYVHWVLYNIPPATTGLDEGIAPTDLPLGTLQGRNDSKRTGYVGPCPPIGQHRYFFKLYALDKVLSDLKEPTKDTLLSAMKAHVIGEAQLMGTYVKAGNR